MSCLRAAHILSKTLSGVGCAMAALLTSSSVRYLAARGSETFISVWFSAKYCAMIPPPTVKLAAGLTFTLNPNSCFRNKSFAGQFQKASGWLFRKSEQNNFNSFTCNPKDYLGGETFLAESIRECQRVQLYRINQRRIPNHSGRKSTAPRNVFP